jgi:starch synthase
VSAELPSATAEAESVHIEEPLPDEEPAPHPAQSPHAYVGPSLYIVHITPEMAPVAKVGGLADVVFGLSRELAIRGNHVEIILPKYDSLRYDHIFELHRTYDDLWVPWYDGAIHCTVYFGFVHDRKCFFIEPHSQDNFFNRGSIYGFQDDVMRYAFFSRAAMEFLFKAGKHPDVIHCHDWQTALVPVYLFEIYQHLGMAHPRVCLTIHNFKHQGVTGMEVLRAGGLHKPEHFFDYHRLRDNHNPHALNLLKGGIVYANFTTTVSPRYAFETKDDGQGFGLEPTLHTHHMKYGGVVNGIDYDVWNPEIDHHLPVRYGVDSIEGKYDNKRALRHRLLLADGDKPIVAFIGRLDPQKGLELVRHAIFYTLERGAQFVLLGSSPDAGINADFWGLKGTLNDSPDCHLEIGFDEDLAHLIYAGADMMLVPSRFEPCGLTQLIALRYGTIPVVREVGGLADTVFDKDHSHRPLHERNGYSFRDYDGPGLESALERAIACYYNYPEHFRELMKNAMRSDYSWNIPGKDYLNIYDYIRHK